MAGQKILITGASGYIGGSLISLIQSQSLVDASRIYALVRKDEHEAAVRKLGLHPLRFNLDDKAEVEEAIVRNEISVVVHFAGVLVWGPLENFLDALAKVHRATGQTVHLAHTSGAKIFSSWAGSPPLKDGQGNYVPIFDDDKLYDHQKGQKAVDFPPSQAAVDVNTRLLEKGDELGVRTYVIAPPIVYGKGIGFGNKISIQTVAIIKLGKALKKVLQYSGDDSPWVFCHIEDCALLYARLVSEIVAGNSPPHGKSGGFYFAENGDIRWTDAYKAIARRMHHKGLIETDEVAKPTNDEVQRAAEVLGGSIPFLKFSVAGECFIQGTNAKENLGWKPTHDRADFIASMSEEVDFVTEQLK